MMLSIVIIISLLCVAPLGNTNPDIRQVTSSPNAVDVTPIEEAQGEKQ
jgi:hypothetical protein